MQRDLDHIDTINDSPGYCFFISRRKIQLCKFAAHNAYGMTSCHKSFRQFVGSSSPAFFRSSEVLMKVQYPHNQRSVKVVEISASNRKAHAFPFSCLLYTSPSP